MTMNAVGVYDNDALRRHVRHSVDLPTTYNRVQVTESKRVTSPTHSDFLKNRNSKDGGQKVHLADRQSCMDFNRSSYVQGKEIARHSFHSDSSSFKRNENRLKQDVQVEYIHDSTLYKICWNGGFLGVIFRNTSKKRVVIRRVDPNAPGDIVSAASVGDVLIGINEKDVSTIDCVEVMKMLRNPSFPVDLTFQPYKSLPKLAKSSGSATSSDFTNPITDRTSMNLSPSKSKELSTADHREFNSARNTEDNNDIVANNDNTKASTIVEYSVVWKEGSLGVRIHNVNNLPVVQERVKFVDDIELNAIQVDDTLVRVNDVCTKDFEFEFVINMLRKEPKPFKLVFSRNSTASLPVDTNNCNSNTNNHKESPQDHEVLNNDSNEVPNDIGCNTNDSMSLTFLKNNLNIRPTLSSREAEYSLVWESGPLGITLRKNEQLRLAVIRLNGIGLAARSNLISLGDELISVSGTNVSEMKVIDAVQYLQQISKPSTLIFHRVEPHSNANSEMNDSSGILQKQYSMDRYSEMLCKPPSFSDYNVARPRRLSEANEKSKQKIEFDSSRTIFKGRGNYQDCRDGGNALSGKNSSSPKKYTPPAPILEASESTSENQLEYTDTDYTKFSTIDDTFEPSTNRSVVNRRSPRLVQTGFTTYSDLDDSGLLPHSNAYNYTHSSRTNGGDAAQNPVVTFKLKWELGKLGLTLRKLSNNEIVVNRFTGHSDIEGLQNHIFPGDSLLSINDYLASDIGFDKTMELLRVLPKPIRLEFRIQQHEEEEL